MIKYIIIILFIISILLLSCVSKENYIAKDNNLYEISIMSFNIKYDYENNWDERKEIIKDFITIISPDILGLQEISSADKENFLENNRPMEWIKSEFSNEYNIIGENSFSPLLVRKEGYTIIESGVYWLSSSPEIEKSNDWGNIVPTSVSWAIVEQDKTGKKFVVNNTHLSAFRASARKKSIELIYSRLPQNIPAIIAGDFNELPFGFVINYLEKFGFSENHKGMIGTFRVLPNTRFSFFRIDYIMTRGFINVSSRIDILERENVFASDHNAITSYLHFNRNL